MLVTGASFKVDALQTGRGSVEAALPNDQCEISMSLEEAKMERMLTWMLAPAVHGIPASLARDFYVFCRHQV